MPPDLHFKAFGSGPPLIILHGLFGSWEVWYPIARALANRARVFALDQRNHGRSFHSARFEYDVLADDIRGFMDSHGLEAATLLGHSMGGKAAMRCAALFPQRVLRMIIVDVTHRATGPVYVEAVEALRRLDLAALTRLKDADERLQAAIPDPALRGFLLKNIDRRKDGAWRWKVNLEAIGRNLAPICGPVTIRPFAKPCLFIGGGRSDYIHDEQWRDLTAFYPRARLVTIPQAGHWVHVDARAAFLQAVEEFLNQD